MVFIYNVTNSSLAKHSKVSFEPIEKLPGINFNNFYEVIDY